MNYTCCLTACIHALFLLFLSFVFFFFWGWGMYSIMHDERDYPVFVTLVTVSFKSVFKCYNCYLPPCFLSLSPIEGFLIREMDKDYSRINPKTKFDIKFLVTHDSSVFHMQ